MRRGIIVTADGSLERVGADLSGHDLTGRTLRNDVPDGWPETVRWDTATQSWLPNLPGVRAGLIGALKAARYAAQSAPVTVAGVGVVQADAASISVLNTALAVVAATKAFGLPFPSLRLILLDNTIAILNAEQVVATGLAVAASVQAAVDAYTVKRSALNAATTLAGLWAVVPAQT